MNAPRMPGQAARGASGASPSDPLASLDAPRRAAFARVADQLIPAAHGMPSAADVVDDERLRFVLSTRPDLLQPLVAALGMELGQDVAGGDVAGALQRLERDAPEQYAVLTFVIVAGYYTDATVRERIGYPGQQRIVTEPGAREAYLDEGLLDGVIARGPIWRDPAAGQRAEHKESKESS